MQSQEDELSRTVSGDLDESDIDLLSDRLNILKVSTLFILFLQNVNVIQCCVQKEEQFSHKCMTQNYIHISSSHYRLVWQPSEITPNRVRVCV